MRAGEGEFVGRAMANMSAGGEKDEEEDDE